MKTFVTVPLVFVAGQENHDIDLDIDSIESFSGSAVQINRATVKVVMKSGVSHTCDIPLYAFRNRLTQAIRTSE